MTKFLIIFLTLFLTAQQSSAQIIFSESFDGTTTPAGWTQTATTGDGWKFSTGAGYDVSATLDHTGNGGNYAWIDFSGTDVGVILEFPIVNVSALTTPYLEFYHESHYTGTLTPFNFLYLEAWDGTTWNIVQTFQGNTPFGWDKYGFNLSAYIYNGTDVRLRFRGESGGSSSDFYNDLLLDDITISELPTCPAPGNLSVSNVLSTSADLAWVETGSATNWEIEYGAAGFAQGTGTVVATTNNPFSLTGLNSNTDYSFYVRSVCAPNDTSFWTGPANFLTPCANVVGDVASDAIIVNTLPFNYAVNIDSCYTNVAGQASPDVFFQFVIPDCIDSLTFSICGSDFDTYLSIFASDTTTRLDFNDDNFTACGSSASSIFINVLTDAAYSFGDTVYILAEGFGSNTGNLVLDIDAKESTTYASIAPLACDSFVSPNGMVRFSSANYIDTIPNAVGCDSIITIALTVGATTTDTMTVFACDSYTSPSGKMWTMSNTYQDTIPNASGCDSLITVNLTVANTSTDTMTVTACDSYTSPSGKVWIFSNTYQDTIMNAAGCDSLITVYLTVNASSTSFMRAGQCYSYTAPSGKVLTTSNVYLDTIMNAAGCDSIITLDVTIFDNTTETISPLACYTYTSPSGKVINTSGNYMDTIPSAAGCDSIITINLTVTSIDTTVTLNGKTLMANEPNANYQWINCNQNNAQIAGVTAQSFEPSIDGSYSVMVSKNGCTQTTACTNVTGVSITKIGFSTDVNAYPNPTNGNVLVELGKVYEDVSVKIMTISGQLVDTQQFDSVSQFELTIDGNPGLYIIEVQTKTQERAILKVTKW